MEQKWNERYAASEYIYGTRPNAHFKEIIDRLKPGKLLVPAAGEGRDAVYAASLGWEVLAFDYSSEGCQKARNLAQSKNVQIQYQVTDVEDFDPGLEKFDLIVLNFFHLPPDIRKPFHQKLDKWLNIGGLVVLEAFNPAQIQRNSGGPKELSLLMVANDLKEEFKTLHIITCTECETELDEGDWHSGKAAVVRFVGQKL